MIPQSCGRKQMIESAYRGVVRGGMVLLHEKTPLTDSTEVLVTPMSSVRGAGAAIVAALETAPKVPAAWVDELEHLIAEGQRASAPPELFADEMGGKESR